MAAKRMVSTGFLASDEFNELSLEQQYLYIL